MDVTKIAAAVAEAAVFIQRPVPMGGPAMNPTSTADAAVFNELCRVLPALRDLPIVGEEVAQGPPKGEACWLIDAIDGTLNYLAGGDEFVVAVCLVDTDGIPELAVVHRPVPVPTTYTALRGVGAWRDGKALATRCVDGVPPIVAFGIPAHGAEMVGATTALLRQLHTAGVVTRQSGSAALDVCRVAEGTRQGFIQFDVELWDVLAADLVAREAGATGTRWPVGNPANRLDYLVSTTEHHAVLERILGGCR